MDPAAGPAAARMADPEEARRRSPAPDSAAGSDPGAGADPGEGSSPADCALRTDVTAIAQHPDGLPDCGEAVRVDVADHQLRIGSGRGEDLTER